MRVLITGANRGIGACLAELLTTRGDEVLATTRRFDGLISLDVTDPGAHLDLARRLRNDTLDAVVCNAGIYHDKGQRLEGGYPARMWAETFAVNVTGVFLTIQALLPMLRRSERPRVLILGSQMGASSRARGGGSYIYRASKAAVLNLGQNLAADLRAENVAVGIYHPGWVRTELGGNHAEITVSEAAAGLVDRLDALSLDTTGSFQTWDGREHPV